MEKDLKKLDFLIYLTSFISLILIVLLLSSSKSISYDIGIYNNSSSNENIITSFETVNEINATINRNIREEILFRTENNEEEKEKEPEKEKQDKTKLNKISIPDIQEKINIKKPIKNKKKAKEVRKKLSSHKKVYHIVQKGECLWIIAKRYNVSVEEIVTLNNIKNPDIIQIGQKLIIPQELTKKLIKDKKIGLKRAKKNLISNISKRKNYLRKKRIKFRWPLIGRITSEFGVRRDPKRKKMEFHTGIDIAAPPGKKFVSAEDGKVIFIGRKGGYGLTIIIQHSKGYKTLYGHCLIALVKKGQYVKKGQVIGRVGESGLSTGPHLHFEIRKNEVAIDPTTLINKRKLFY